MDGLTAREQLAQVEDALLTYPLAEAPADLAGRVMRRVRAAPAQRFRLSWLDWTISLAVPGIGMALLVAWGSLPPQTAAFLQTRLPLLWQSLQRTGLGWVLPAGGLTTIGVFIAMTVRLLRPAYRRPKLVRTTS